MSALVVVFETPKYGWLPVRVALGGKQFEFAGSDVLNNPLDDLVDALESAARGGEGSVWWFLEPGGYWFDFVPREERIEVRVFVGGRMSGSDRVLEASYEGPREEVLVTFWKAVEVVVARGLKEPDWPPIDARRFEMARKVVRAEG